MLINPYDGIQHVSMTVSSEENRKDYPGLLLLMDLCVHPRQVEYERSTYDAVVSSICASEMAEDTFSFHSMHYEGSLQLLF